MRKRKKIISIILVFCMLSTMFPVSAIDTVDTANDEISLSSTDVSYALTEDVSGYCGGEGDGTNLTWTLTTDGTLTISGTGAMEGALWQDYADAITDVVIEDGVTCIGYFAFTNCVNLLSVIIPDSVTKIETHAFKGCTSLESIILPDSITDIGTAAFSGCSALTSVTLPRNLISIATNLFEDCSVLASIDVPESVTSIGVQSFKNCVSLTSIVIPENVTSIDDWAFEGCSALASITIPEKVTTISYAAFYNCTGLTSVILPDDLIEIGELAFYFCESLKAVEIPDNVTTIGASAFEGCSSLDSIAIPNGVTVLEDSVFDSCTSLKSITIPEGVTQIGERAFCSASLTSVAIPNKVTSIETSAFLGCTNLAEINLPNSVTNIAEYAFFDCGALTTVNYSGTKAQWNAITIEEGNEPLLNATIHFLGEEDSPTEVSVSGITLDQTSITLEIGETATLTATILPENATDKTATWTSGNTDVATVDNGFVTAVAPGETVITASTGNGVYTVSCDVTVIAAGTDPNDINGDGYHDGDVAVINAIIRNNGLAWMYDDPASWPLRTPLTSSGVRWNDENIKRVTWLDILAWDLTGSLNLSGLTELVWVSCGDNDITELNVSNLPKLEELYCSDSRITELDVSDLTNLTVLACSMTNLTALDVSNLTQLTQLECEETQITELDVAELKELTYLDCSESAMATLNIADLTNMQYLDCASTNITELDVSNLTSLTTLWCRETGITELDVSKLTELVVLHCENTFIAELNVSDLTKLIDLHCGWTEIAELDVANLTCLLELSCSNTNITALDVADLTELTYLDCSETAVAELDVSNLVNLNRLFCSATEITELDVANLTNLEMLHCSRTGITELDVSDLTNLIDLYCEDTNITVLDVSNLTNLLNLWCCNTNIAELDVSNLVNLRNLICNSTNITALDTSNLANLTTLNCASTDIAELDLSNLTNLTALHCGNTDIVKLGVSDLTNLETLDCRESSITALDLSNLTKLSNLYCNDTPLLTITVPAGYTVGSTAYGSQPLDYALPTPAQEDCTFIGWFIASTGGEQVQVGDTFTETTILHSQWNKPVTGIMLDRTTLELEVGESTTLTVTFIPDDATNQNVIWSSSDESVATVGNGTVTAVAAGTATITVTTENGVFTATCEVTVIPAAAAHSHSVCGSICTHSEEPHEIIVFDQVLTADTAMISSGSYYLTDNVALTGTLEISGTVNLCLNGYKLTGPGGQCISIHEGAVLNLCDCNGSGSIHTYYVDENGMWVFSEDSGNSISGGVINGIGEDAILCLGAFNMYGGTIAGSTRGVLVETRGEFVLYDGRIAGNYTEKWGAGVSSFGHVVMLGGEISDNVAVHNGAGVFIEATGSFVMNGGNILRNAAQGSGGGVLNAGEFVMNGGVITQNSARLGGGVHNFGVFTLNDGEIAENTAEVNGGGVFNESETRFAMNGGTISRNSAGSDGGGVLVAGEFTMTDGTISANDAQDSGGGVVVSGGVFVLENGEISENTAETFGGAVYIESYGVFTMNGGTLTGNNAMHGTVFVNAADSTFNMSGGLVDSNLTSNAVYSNGVFNMTGGTISNHDGNGVYSSGTFTMHDGIIEGHARGVYNHGAFIMTGGTIRSNWSDGVMNHSLTDYEDPDLDSYATMKMSGGLISGNSTGMYIGADSTVTITGGSITGNTDGGVWVEANAVFSVSGSPIIVENTSWDAAQNVFLCSGAVITIDDTSDDVIPLNNAAIGVTTEGTGVVTITGENTEDYSEFFTSDDPRYTVVRDGLVLKLSNDSGYSLEWKVDKVPTGENNPQLQVMLTTPLGETDSNRYLVELFNPDTGVSNSYIITGNIWGVLFGFDESGDYTHVRIYGIDDAGWATALDEWELDKPVVVELAVFAFPCENVSGYAYYNSVVGSYQECLIGFDFENYGYLIHNPAKPHTRFVTRPDTYFAQEYMVGPDLDICAHYAEENEQAFYVRTSESITMDILIKEEVVVNYDANGGSGQVPETVKELEGAVICVAGQGELTNGSYQFVGWNTKANGTGVAYQPGAQMMIKGNTTLYAQWRINDRTVSGTITGHKGVTYVSVTAKLVSTDGVEYIGTVDAGIPDGEKTQYPYSVNAPDGKYDLVVVAVTDEGVEVTRTHTVNLKNKDATQHVNLPNGQAKAKSNVVVEQDAPQVLADGLDDIVDETIEENENVTAVEVTLVVEAVDETNSEAAQIREQTESDELEFVELTIRKEVTISSGEVESENMSELSNTVELVIPFDCEGKKDIKVHRYHGDQVDTLTTAPNADGEWIELGGDHIVIHAKKFSTYAIGYSNDSTPEDPVVRYTIIFDSNGGTGEMKSVVVEKNTEYALPECSFTAPEGKQFKAWRINGTEYAVGDNITVTADITVKAVWENVPASPVTPDIPAPPETPFYSVVVEDVEGGTIRVTPKSAAEGTTVVITVITDEGRELVEVVITAANGKVIPWRSLGDNEYAFVMPASKVTVSAIFHTVDKGCLKDETCPIWSFKDAEAAEWYHDGVHYCIENGLMNGLPSNLFDPNGTTTRAQIVTILWRLESMPVVNYAMSFADIAADEWYTEAVRWAAAEGIVIGYSDTQFAPNDAITREQMTVILYRYCQYKGIDVSVGEDTNILSYADAFDIHTWAISAMQWACGAGIINGIADGDSMKLVPSNNATRAQVAMILWRFCEKVMKD